MRDHLLYLRILFIACASVASGIGALSFCSYTTNCGGNSAALAQVAELALAARLGASQAPNHTFRFADFNPGEREELTSLARSGWLRHARFFVYAGPVTEQMAGTHRLIAVCDTPYRNVPEHWLWQAPPTHAAGYGDGTKGLISPAEFAALDRSAFRPLDELYPGR